MGRWLEKWFGIALVAASLLWAGYHVARHGSFNSAFIRLGPLQALMLGLMIWLHGKFGKAVEGMHPSKPR